MTEMLRPEDLRRIADEQETRKMAEVLARTKKAEAQQRELHDAFMHWESVRPNAMELLTQAVRRAGRDPVLEGTDRSHEPARRCPSRGVESQARARGAHDSTDRAAVS